MRIERSRHLDFSRVSSVTLDAPFHTAERMASQAKAPPPMITTLCSKSHEVRLLRCQPQLKGMQPAVILAQCSSQTHCIYALKHDKLLVQQ
jgi:hypothetical protein